MVFMKGLTTMKYILLISLLALISTQIISMAMGYMSGTPVYMSQHLLRLKADFASNNTAIIPQNFECFMTNCDITAHPSLSDDDFNAVNEFCGPGWPSTVCLFYDYLTFRYRMCEGLITEFDSQYYFDGKKAYVLGVERTDIVVSLKVSNS